jgi:hypothetical protein
MGYLLIIAGGSTAQASFPDLDQKAMDKAGGAVIQTCYNCSSCSLVTLMTTTMGATEYGGPVMILFNSGAAADAWRALPDVKPKLERRLVFGHDVMRDAIKAWLDSSEETAEPSSSTCG